MHLRTLVAAIVLLLVSAGSSLAQRAPAAAPAPPAVPLDLSVPESPAFIIVGVSPTEIARPVTPTALAVSIASSAAGSTNFLPANYALEFAPYWWGNPALELGDYLKPGIVQSIAQTLSISFATAREGTLVPADNAGIGVGVNTALFAGQASTAFRQRMAAMSVDRITYLGLRTALRALNRRLADATSAYNKTHLAPTQTPTAGEQAAFAQLATGFGSLPTQVNAIIEASVSAVVDPDDPQLEEHRKQVIERLKTRMQSVYESALSPTTYPLQPLSDAATRLLLLRATAGEGADAKADINFVTTGVALERILETMTSMRDAARESIETKADAIQAADKLRRGFLLSVSGAVATNIPDASFTDAKLARWGVWASPAWRFDAQPIEVLGVLRMIVRPEDEGPDLIDFGARIVQHFNDITWAAEYVQRFEQDSPSGTSVKSQRVTANVEYKFREAMFLTAAFGKDFADPQAGQPKGGLVSLLGINFGFGKKPKIPIPGVPVD